jgi:hypothetical protein
MNIKQSLVSALFIFSFQLSALAISIEEIKADRENYIWGEGSGETLKAADQTALADIIGQISVQVENSFSQLSTETNRNVSQTVNDVINTYSSATLRNTDRIILKNEPDAKVFRYVKRTEISKIFESRRNKLIEFAHDGEQAFKNLQLADALRYYYWAQTLLRSHPDANEIRMKDLSGVDVLLITWLPKQIKNIFANLNIRVDRVEDMGTYLNYVLDIRYGDVPVRNLDYTYWSGQDWSNIVSAKDGLGILELTKTQKDADIRLKAEYIFEGESNIDLELRDVMQKLPSVPYKSCYLTISSKVNPSKAQSIPGETSVTTETTSAGSMVANVSPSRVAQATSTNSVASYQSKVPVDSLSQAKGKMPFQSDAPEASSSKLGAIPTLTDIADKEAVMAQVRKAIQAKSYADVESLFTKDGFEIYQKLLQYGNARIIRSGKLNYYPFGEYVICRSIPMSFSFKSNNRSFIEDVIFYFNKENKICNLTFGLSSNTVNDIASNTTWREENRVLIMSFLENYKTAYSLKRYDYINNIFSDDALIITGYVTKMNNTPENQYLNNKIIRYNRQTKSEYMKKLRFCFDSNEFINIRFSDNTVRLCGKGKDIYGIQIHQDYYSSNYGDNGYLFLLVDLSNQSKPLIHVRTWQPEKNPDGSIYGPSDF